MKNFGQLRNAVFQNVQIPTTSNYASQIERFLNETYEKVWNTELWPSTLDTGTVTIAINQSEFALPKSWSWIVRARQSTQNLRILDFPSFSDADLPLGTTSSLLDLAVIGDKGIKSQLATAQTVKIKSSVTNDLSVPIYIQGTDSNDEVIHETLNTHASDSTTLVASAKTYKTISHVSKSQNTNGTITLYATDGTTVLATIAHWEERPVYRWYKANGTVSAATDLTITAKKRFRRFIHTFDTPTFEMDNALIYGATAMAWQEHRQPTAAQLWQARFDDALMELTQRELNQDNSADLMLPMTRA